MRNNDHSGVQLFITPCHNSFSVQLTNVLKTGWENLS